MRPRQLAGSETVLGVDTVVTLDDRIYGKPADRDEARGNPARAGRPHPRGAQRRLRDRGRPGPDRGGAHHGRVPRR